MHFNVTDSHEVALRERVLNIVAETPVDDIHTHLYDPAFDKLLLWGIDELLIYHYLVAEAFRFFDGPYSDFWKLDKTAQADRIWDVLFVQHSPVSEACRGVVTTLHSLGLDARKRDLPSIRKWFAEQTVDDHIQNCMQIAGVKSICMTNSPFDDLERPVWQKGFEREPWFTSALRIDPLILDWPRSARRLNEWGYPTGVELNVGAFDAARKFLADWAKKMDARYVMVSLPPDFEFPANTESAELIDQAVLPFCRDSGLPLAVMPGVVRGVNPQLQLAGDGVERSDLTFLKNLCAGFPENRFAATVLARENQHELCVLARKFRNLHIFGCWWFTNTPSIISDMTRMRLELLGLSVTPQHSDARVLDQIIYKWQHSKSVIAEVLGDKYVDLLRSGWECGEAEIRRDVEGLFGGEFARFCGC
ncbi:MAG TPA: glucuronate isomerase [Verrucomicrobiales bacterium]|nr:glucuronate isomerase [Verrucomicrobiales bacterium]